MENDLFREIRINIALEEWTSEYNVLTREENLLRKQQKAMSMMREISLEFDLSVMSSNDEPFSREVIFLYDQLILLCKENLNKMVENP